MSDTFTKITEEMEDEGSGGIATELRRAGEAQVESWARKVTEGRCKSMEAYADAVGFLRGLNFFLQYAENKAALAKRELSDEEKQEI